MPNKRNTRDGSICPKACKTNYHSTYPGKMTLTARAGMLFKYPGLTSLCIIFSPLTLIGRVPQKVNQGKCLMLIITPAWSGQPWFPALLKMSIKTCYFYQHSRTSALDNLKQHPWITVIRRVLFVKNYFKRKIVRKL